MARDPRFALSQELEAKQTLLDQLRALTADDPDFFIDVIEGETNLLELIAALDASIVDDEILVDDAKTALDKLQNRKRTAEARIELKRGLLAHTLQQIGPQDPARADRDAHPRRSASDCPGSTRDFKGLYATLQTPLSLLPCVLLFPIRCPLNYDGESLLSG
jgi:hypothetical protein